MKKYFYFLIPAAMIGAAALLSSYGGDNTDSSGGAPAGYTNSPADGQNCSHCMGGTATEVTGWIFSDVPATGYEPGQTYTITVTASGAGDKGFQVSPQDAEGNLLGTLTPGAGNKLVGSGKYVTHSAPLTTNPAAWTFQWTAPDPGVGDIRFYGSIAVTKTVTKTTTMTISQSTVGLQEKGFRSFSVHPVPVRDHFTVAFENPVSANVTVSLLSLNGSKITTLASSEVPAGKYSRSFSISQPAGVYLLQVIAGEQIAVKKVVVQ